MNRKTKKVLNSILTLMLAVCVVMVIKSTMEDATSQKDYDEANMLAGNQEVETEETTVPAAPEALPPETEPETSHAQEPIPIPDDLVIRELMETDLEALRQFRRQPYWEEHPTFYIVCDQGVLRYDIFAVHRAGVDTIIFGLNLDTDEKKTRFIRFATDYSSYDTGIEPIIEDRVVTLSTCSGQGYTTRWVVQGVLNEAGSYIIAE